MPARRTLRDVNEDARDIARRKMETKAFLKSRDQRKRVEMRFAHLKTHHGFERLRLRGLSGARDEFHLAAIVQSCRRSKIWNRCCGARGPAEADISSAEAVKNAVLAAKSVAYSTGASGFYLADLFKRMGIADQIKDKVKQTPSGVQVGEVVAHGEADLGFQQVSELLHLKGIHYVGPLPADIQHITVFSAALHTAAPAPDAAKALVKFLTGPDAGPIIKKIGMEPG